MFRISVLLGLFALAMSGCVSVASIKNLPSSNAGINYDEIDKDKYGHYEYVFELTDVDDERFYKAASEGLTSNRFEIVETNKALGVVKAKRGLSFNEWGSVVGVYNQQNGPIRRVKVIVEITQDITGTLPQSYAENIAIRIKNSL